MSDLSAEEEANSQGPPRERSEEEAALDEWMPYAGSALALAYPKFHQQNGILWDRPAPFGDCLCE